MHTELDLAKCSLTECSAKDVPLLDVFHLFEGFVILNSQYLLFLTEIHRAWLFRRRHTIITFCLITVIEFLRLLGSLILMVTLEHRSIVAHLLGFFDLVLTLSE